MVSACVFPRCAQTTPVRATVGVVFVKFGNFTGALARAAGGGGVRQLAWTSITAPSYLQLHVPPRIPKGPLKKKKEGKVGGCAL